MIISDAAIAEVRALGEARRAKYLAEQEHEDTIRSLAREIQQHSPLTQSQARSLAEHLIGIGCTLGGAE